MDKKTDKEKLLEIFREAGLWIRADGSDYFKIVSEAIVGFCFDEDGNLLKLI